jgi:predicted enzyme related to lactoylglutathione lyase
VERVTGIGGVFFRARDPEALMAWYAEHLGLDPGEGGSVLFRAGAGDATVWAPFSQDTEYFGGPAQWMVNFRVSDLDAMLQQLRHAGVEVEDKTEDYDYGRFGWARDPEGNRIELWEPTGP